MLLTDTISMSRVEHPDRPALVTAAGALTYADLEQRVERLGAGLRERLSPGARVAIVAQNRQEYVEAYFGVPAGGCVLTLVNYRLHPREMAWIIENASADALLVERRYREPLLRALAEAEVDVPLVVTLDDEGSSLEYEALHAEPDGGVAPPSADDTAWIIYTSGTTGRPKGAMLSHRNLIASAVGWMAVARPERGSRCLMSFPLCHVAGYVIPRYFLQGSTVVLTPGFTPGDFLDLVETHRIESASLAPTMIDMVLSHPDRASRDLSSLRTIGYGGSSIGPALLERAMQAIPTAGYTQGFGMTETAGNIVMMDQDMHRRAASGEPQLLPAAGVVMPLVGVRVVDADLVDVAVGEVGEVIVRGDQVMQGYWDNPAATADAFRDGWFLTGDLARRDAEGFVYVVDRRKDMIVSGGENVYSREVEDVLTGLSGVREAAVIGLPDDRWGEAVSAVVVDEGVDLTTDDVVDHCRDHLASFKIPRHVHFVDELPRNATGKVLKRVLRERLVDGAATIPDS